MSVGTKMGTFRYHFHFAWNTTYFIAFLLGSAALR